MCQPQQLLSPPILPTPRGCRVYNDSEGREHVQLQFHMRGPSGRATVNAGEGAAAWGHVLWLSIDGFRQMQPVEPCC